MCFQYTELAVYYYYYTLLPLETEGDGSSLSEEERRRKEDPARKKAEKGKSGKKAPEGIWSTSLNYPLTIFTFGKQTTIVFFCSAPS